MATKKDLVEAHAFSRRRLVTAFVSGAPGGREVEPVRPGRVLIGGVALSVLLLAGAAIAGFLVGRPPAEWLAQDSFVISKDTGEQYVVMKGGEHPLLQRVPNYVSAQLLLHESELTPYTVRDKYIRTVALGDDLGIESAPASLPAADELVDDGWTACTADRAGVKVAVHEAPQVQDVVGSAFLVRSAGSRWLIAQSPDTGDGGGSAYRLELPRTKVQASTIVDQLGFDQEVPVVDQEWLDLFPVGGSLEASSFGVSGQGHPDYSDTTTDLSSYNLGDLLVTPKENHYLLGDDGPERLDEFPALVYAVVHGAALPVEAEITSAFVQPKTPDTWPTERPAALSPSALCAVLHPGHGRAPISTLAINPTGSAPVGDAIGRGEHDVDVEPSGGAYVLSGSYESASAGTPYVIDTKGEKYQLDGPEVPDFIGYGSVSPPMVPSAWLAFFQEGVVLSTNGARRVSANAPPPEDAAATP